MEGIFSTEFTLGVPLEGVHVIYDEDGREESILFRIISEYDFVTMCNSGHGFKTFRFPQQEYLQEFYNINLEDQLFSEFEEGDWKERIKRSIYRDRNKALANSRSKFIACYEEFTNPQENN